MYKKNEYLSYAIDCASYIISKTENIDRIILHGSIARKDFDEKSDVDLFIDTTDKKINEKISKIIEDYYKTETFKKWKLKGIQNQFSIIVGKLDSEEWKDLKRAIINTGIILFGKYKSDIEKVNQYTLFSFENIKPDKKRISIFRKLFGFKMGPKKYAGLIDEINAIKVGKGSILVPIEHTNKLKDYFQGKKVNVKLYDLWSDIQIT